MHRMTGVADLCFAEPFAGEHQDNTFSPFDPKTQLFAQPQVVVAHHRVVGCKHGYTVNTVNTKAPFYFIFVDLFLPLSGCEGGVTCHTGVNGA